MESEIYLPSGSPLKLGDFVRSPDVAIFRGEAFTCGFNMRGDGTCARENLDSDLSRPSTGLNDRGPGPGPCIERVGCQGRELSSRRGLLHGRCAAPKAMACKV